MKLKEAVKKVEDGTEETLTYCNFPCEHWTRIHTNNVIERLNREMRRRTRVEGWQIGPYADLCQAPPCGWYPVGQQEVHVCCGLTLNDPIQSEQIIVSCSD